MFSLIYGLWQYIFQKEELRILILGAGLPTPPPPSPNRPVLGPVPSRCYRLPSGRTPGNVVSSLRITALRTEAAMPGCAAQRGVDPLSCLLISIVRDAAVCRLVARAHNVAPHAWALQACTPGAVWICDSGGGCECHPAMCAMRSLTLPYTGVDKAGKTTLLERLKSMYGTTPGTPPERILPTVGLNVGRMQVRAGMPMALARPASELPATCLAAFSPMPGADTCCSG